MNQWWPSSLTHIGAIRGEWVIVVYAVETIQQSIYNKRSILQPMISGPFSWWRHQKETFSALPAICAGNNRCPVNSPHKGQWRGAFMFCLICTRINGWLNNGEAGDLRRYRAHYDVTVMSPYFPRALENGHSQCEITLHMYYFFSLDEIVHTGLKGCIEN